MSLCLVSAFLDIGRQGWSVFQRSMTQYFMNFFPYIKMLQSSFGLQAEMIVFMDDKHVDALRQLCRMSNITIIPINRTWMQEHIHAYRQLPRETEIMESSKFRNLVQHRLRHPECSKPEYNIMQHAKIDFVCHVIEQKLSQAKYYAWTDFGYFQNPSRIPTRPLNIGKFDLERVNFQAMSEFTSLDFNIMYTLTQAPERVGGFFFLGNAEQLRKYQRLYHNICAEFHEQGIVDDDQHIMIQSVARDPDLFKVWNLGGWHLVYLYFQ